MGYSGNIYKKNRIQGQTHIAIQLYLKQLQANVLPAHDANITVCNQRHQTAVEHLFCQTQSVYLLHMNQLILMGSSLISILEDRRLNEALHESTDLKYSEYFIHSSTDIFLLKIQFVPFPHSLHKCKKSILINSSLNKLACIPAQNTAVYCS